LKFKTHENKDELVLYLNKAIKNVRPRAQTLASNLGLV